MLQLSHPYMATRGLEKPDLPPEEVILGERNRASHVGILKKHDTYPPSDPSQVPSLHPLRATDKDEPCPGIRR